MRTRIKEQIQPGGSVAQTLEILRVLGCRRKKRTFGVLPTLWKYHKHEIEDHRPPVYNPEDYASALKKWSRRSGPLLYASNIANSDEATMGPGNTNTAPPRYNWRSRSTDNLHQEPTSLGGSRDFRNPNLTSCSQGEMTLRQFSSVSELLNKLRQDLRLALPSFVQEFVGDPLDGVTLLLEILRAVQLSQTTQKTRIPPAIARRALLDEHECLQCLQSCVARSQEGARRLASSPAGLFTVAVGIMSNVTKSRILALQLLTRACEPPANGHSAVSEAMSTLRLRFGEPVRFRFLVGMLSSGAGASSPQLQSIGLRFVNTFLEAAPSPQIRLYIQAEVEQAGLQPSTIRKSLPANAAVAEEIQKELKRWENGYLDINTLEDRAKHAENEISSLREKTLLLERKLQILQEEKSVLLSLERSLKERCTQLEGEVKHHQHIISPKSSKVGSTPEDEGISSSDQPSSGEEGNGSPLTRRRDVIELKVEGPPILRETSVDQQDSDEEETTIEEVMEELRNIINDAESEDRARMQREQDMEIARISNKNRRPRQRAPTEYEERVSLDTPNSDEIEIIPTRLPQPPRRSRALAMMRDGAQGILFFDEETPSDTSDSDSLLSASREPEPTQRPTYVYGSRPLVRRETISAHPVTPIRRSESFQHQHRPSQIQYNPVPVITKETTTHPLFFLNDPPRPSNGSKSKSLEKIDEGLNSMVDIVTHVRWETPQVSLHHDYRSNGFPRYSDRYPPDGASSGMSGSALFISPREQSPPSHHYKAPFIKRGHVNAGLYSGQIKPMMQCQSSSNSRTASVPSSAGRLADLPSGLY
ncbi:uncharacterized protein LOC132198106 isoform X2 [Neocloeon triangulifer]|uniref:uncharacterized protein LOC132198106 isoform X2 n=1 Tax=Neocloeon triangulifer TaxID=2078957 RepID=UPI00286EC2D6|nr:uncharacterized protein LOC132198106 isoform X2 [Neocloeon triangulifer]